MYCRITDYTDRSTCAVWRRGRRCSLRPVPEATGSVDLGADGSGADFPKPQLGFLARINGTINRTLYQMAGREVFKFMRVMDSSTQGC